MWVLIYPNEFIDDMHRFRDEGPAYPYVIIPEFAQVTCMKNEGADNDDVINRAPGQLPEDFFEGK
ncbi:phenolic acid decarboxylase [Pantoea sp. C3]|uniref:phenolic acid decarboxylase n=1 Tax=Pantoea phytostimulans TaxID=2769024 RepID=UPI0038F6FABB